MDMKQIGSDYTLERWLAIIFSLLFLLPWIADAQPSGGSAPQEERVVVAKAPPE